MAKPYKQLTYLERKRIEEGLDSGLSFRAIAQSIGRSPSSISREVKTNRIRCKTPATNKRHCSIRRECDIRGICKDKCPYKGHELCSKCIHINCTEVCMRYTLHSGCSKLNSAPWVCNGCRRRHMCKHHGSTQWLYLADASDNTSKARRSETRRGLDMDADTAEVVLSKIKEGLSRGLSPYEISICYKDKLPISVSTIYRWVEAGYGGLLNIELERKVGFKKRTHHAKRLTTRHTSKRSYERYMALPEEERYAHTEMDTVLGIQGDSACILSLYLIPCHFQFFLLLKEKTENEVIAAIKQLKEIAGITLFKKMFSCVLTDNGSEFGDEEKLARIFCERKGGDIRLFYCDVCASNQKGSCEKNHSELRQILPKGLISFDELNCRDVSIAMSHTNSNPRARLCGMSPIAMFKAMFGEEGCNLLDAYGIEEIKPDELTLRPIILNIERDKRGEDLLTFHK